MKKEMISKNSLLSATLFLIVGLVLLMGSDTILKFLSWIIGGLLILYGGIKIIVSVKSRNESNAISSGNMTLGVMICLMGLLLIIFPSIVNIMIRILFGGWIMFAGINRLVLAFAIRMVDEKGYKVFLWTSLIMILVGIFVIINIFELIGILIIIYSVCEIIDYVFYKSSNKDYSRSKINSTAPSKVKSDKSNLKKKSKGKKVIEAQIEDVDKK